MLISRTSSQGYTDLIQDQGKLGFVWIIFQVYTKTFFNTSKSFDNFNNSEKETNEKHDKRDVWFNSRPYVLNNHINLSPNLACSETKFAYQFIFIRGESTLPICPTCKHWLSRFRRSHLYGMIFRLRIF